MLVLATAVVAALVVAFAVAVHVVHVVAFVAATVVAAAVVVVAAECKLTDILFMCQSCSNELVGYWKSSFGRKSHVTND